MRRLEFIVLTESILLAALGFAWLLRSSARPETVERKGGATDVHGDGARLSVPVEQASVTGPSSTGETRRRVATPGNAAAGDDIVLSGHVWPPTGEPMPKDLSLSLRREGAYCSATLVGDQYAIPGLTPGTWTLRPYADGIVARTESIEITAVAFQTHDLQLERATVVPVFVRTTDGAPFSSGPSARERTDYLAVVALAQPLTADLPPTDSSSVGSFGLGRWSAAGRLGPPPEPGAALGTLQLDVPPPVHAALLLRHVVLAQQVVPAGATELVFVIDEAAIDARFATVRLRLIDAASGQPITADGHVSFSTSQGGGARARPDEDGTWIAERVLPGITHMVVSAKEREHVSTDFLLRAGETLDLGDLVLGPEVRIRGRLLGTDGQPVSGAVQWTDLDTRRARGTTTDRRHASADGDGDFEIDAGPRRYLVVGKSAEGLVGSIHIDARGGATPRFDLQLAPPVRVVVSAGGDPLRGYALEVLDPHGQLIAAERIEVRSREVTFGLAAGEYTIEVYDEVENLLRRIPVHARGDLVRVEVP